MLRTADGVDLALHRVGPADGQPVLFIPGMFSDRGFFLGTRGVGLARAAAAAGFAAAVLEARGHGMSDRSGARPWGFEDWARYDIPAALEAVTADGREAVLVAHSAGGPAALCALLHRPDLQERVRGIVLLAAPAPVVLGRRLALAASAMALSRAVGRFPARVLGMGPQDEVGGVMAQWMSWNLTGRWWTRDGRDFLAGLGEIRRPVFAVAGAGDRTWAPPAACWSLLSRLGSAPRSYLLCGTATGFAHDYDHAGLVVSAAARREVWPRLLGWMGELGLH